MDLFVNADYPFFMPSFKDAEENKEINMFMVNQVLILEMEQRQSDSCIIGKILKVLLKSIMF